jgi:hypothetical protein
VTALFCLEAFKFLESPLTPQIKGPLHRRQKVIKQNVHHISTDPPRREYKATHQWINFGVQITTNCLEKSEDVSITMIWAHEKIAGRSMESIDTIQVGDKTRADRKQHWFNSQVRGKLVEKRGHRMQMQITLEIPFLVYFLFQGMAILSTCQFSFQQNRQILVATD